MKNAMASLEAAHLSWLQTPTKTKFSQVQRSFRSLTEPILGYGAGQSRVEFRDEPREKPNWSSNEPRANTEPRAKLRVKSWAALRAKLGLESVLFTCPA